MTDPHPGWTTALEDDGWVGSQQRFPTARQVVCWTDCPTCGAEKGKYCEDGRMNKKTGEMLDLNDWLAENDGVAPAAPSCELRRQRGRSELKKRINMEKRKQEQLRKAVDKVFDGRRARKAAKAAQTESLF